MTIGDLNGSFALDAFGFRGRTIHVYRTAIDVDITGVLIFMIGSLTCRFIAFEVALDTIIFNTADIDFAALH